MGALAMPPETLSTRVDTNVIRDLEFQLLDLRYFAAEALHLKHQIEQGDLPIGPPSLSAHEYQVLCEINREKRERDFFELYAHVKKLRDHLSNWDFLHWHRYTEQENKLLARVYEFYQSVYYEFLVPLGLSEEIQNREIFIHFSWASRLKDFFRRRIGWILY